jgi:hypothetical protein
MRHLAEVCRLLVLPAFLILSGCGAWPCLYTDAGCNSNEKKPDNGCYEFGGSTTRCQTLLLNEISITESRWLK